MAGSNNFKQFNPNKNNQEDDATYLADSFRADGAAPGIFNKEVFNKFAYQMSSFVAAMGEMLSAKGYAVSDADFNALKAVLANVMTAVDKIPTAALADNALLLNSLSPSEYARWTDEQTGNLATIDMGAVVAGERYLVACKKTYQQLSGVSTNDVHVVKSAGDAVIRFTYTDTGIYTQANLDIAVRGADPLQISLFGIMEIVSGTTLTLQSSQTSYGTAPDVVANAWRIVRIH